ncbi:MAG: hypothetical protein P8100_13370 [bacterium]
MANYYPPVGFHFRVDIDGISSGDSEIGFQEVSGLNASVGEFTFREGALAGAKPEEAFYVKVGLSISNFNAQQNELVVETIELAFQYFTRLEVN